MEKSILSICLFMSISFSYGQDELSRFTHSRDSIITLINKYYEESTRYKDTDVAKADQYSSDANRLFQSLIDLTVLNIEKYASNEGIIKFLDENFYLVENEFNALSKIHNTLNKYPKFDAVLKNKVKVAYNKLADLQMVNQTAPDFTLPDLSGKETSLSNLKGNYVWLNFWASWCAPCRVKARNTVTIYDQIKKMNIVVLSVAFDEKEKIWRDANTKDGICWLSLRDATGFEGKLKDSYKITTLPTTFLLDPNGKIVLQNCTAEEVMTYVGNFAKFN